MSEILKSPALKIATGSVMISFSAIFVKLTTTGPTVDGFYRMLFGVIGLVVIALVRKKPFHPNAQSITLACLAGILFALDISFWHRSIEHIGPGLATIIINLQVFILGAMGFIFYNEEVTWKYMLAIPIALVGMYLLIGTGWRLHGTNYKIGILQCMVAMLSYTYYIVVLRASQQTKQPLPAITNLAIICFTSAVLLGIIAYFSGESFLPSTDIDWFWLVLYGIFGQILGWLLITQGLPYISITRAGFLLLLQPACSFIWDIIFFDRVTVTEEVFGALLTLAAIFLSNTARQETRKTE